MKTKVHIFKSSGKWYETIEIKIPEVLNPNLLIYDQYAESIRLGSKYKTIDPIYKTKDSWFAVILGDTFPVVIWLN